MPKGQEQVQAALEACRDYLAEARELAAAEVGWKTEVEERLARVLEVLDSVVDKFFLRSKLSIPFASKCDAEAGRLGETLRGLDGRPDEDTQRAIIGALDALEKAAKALEKRSAMQGMAIT